MDTSQQVQDRKKVDRSDRNTYVRIAAAWLIVLIAGVLAISQLQTYLIDHRQALLYTNTYLSSQPFGPETKVIKATQYPMYWWMNYQAYVPKTCQVSSDVIIRKRTVVNGVEYLAATALNNSHIEGRALPTTSQIRRLAVSYDVYNINPWFKQPGNYEIQRISRFQCGSARASNLTSTQVVKFQIIP